VDLGALRDAVNAAVKRAGVTFATGDGEAFVLDPVPRILPSEEWRTLAAGLEQRVRALNAFVVDAYGPRRIVEAGHMSAEVIDSAEGYEPDVRGCLPAGVAPIGIAGLDIVRSPDGTLLVLEDNARTPSGLAYAVAARRAVAGELPAGVPEPVAIADAASDLLVGVMRAAAYERAGEMCAVVLGDGPDGGAAWEHAQAATALGAPLVTLGDLEHRGGRLHARLEDGRLRPVDVVYRRADEDRLRDDAGRPTAIAALLEPWLAGPGGRRQRLRHRRGRRQARPRPRGGHDPLLPRRGALIGAVPTLDLRDADAREAVLADLRGHVVKPRFGHGGAGVVIGAHADAATLVGLRDEVEARPEGFIAQPIVPLSSHPTVVNGALAPRHVDLRPFVFAAGEKMGSLPGGLTRVAWDAGALVVNSSQNGGAKDTWVLRPSS
jgi:uncharacterized circularly permuted ATP-grasp superfamily protein